MAQVAKEEREELIEMVSEIYRKHDFEFMHVSKRIENVPPVGWDRGRSSIHILRSLFGVDWEEMVQVCSPCKCQTQGFLQVIYAGDSAADEFAMEVLRGVASSFKVNCPRDLSGLYWSLPIPGDQRRHVGADKNLGQRPTRGPGCSADNAQVIHLHRLAKNFDTHCLQIS